MTQYANLDLSAFFSLQTMKRLFVSHHFAHIRLIVHSYNLVTSQDADFFRRTTFNDARHSYRIFANDKLNTHTAERTLQIVVGSLGIFG